MSGVVVTKGSPVVVRPSELEPSTPAATDTVALSSFDSCMPPFPVTMLLVFDRAIDEPVETIKRALSRALAHYPPIAGRLDGAGSSIACTGEGVTFVPASASCSLEEAANAAALPHMDLAVVYPGLLCRSADPLLLVQVTEFSCGWFTVGVTWNHLLADAAGMVQFLQAAGELARGVSPPSVVPVRRWDDDDDSLPSLPSSTIAAQKSTLLDYEPQRVARLDVVIPSALVGRIKAGGLGGEPCTTFDVVAAVLWRCCTRAALSAAGAGESVAPLTFPCNVRKHVGAPAGFYGNCVAMQVVPATVGVVANSDVGSLVRLIRSAKEKVAGLLSGRGGGGGGDGDGGGVGGQAAAPLWYEALAVSSWRNMGLDATDFGGGAPARVLWRTEQPTVPSCVVCPPRRTAGRDGGVEVSSMFLKPEHVDAFLGELARLAAASEE